MLIDITRAELTLKQFLRSRRDARRIARYLRSSRRPWTTGYHEYRGAFIESVLHDEAQMRPFRSRGPLPVGFGVGIDERAVELPWVVAQLDGAQGRLLDAGSALNYEYLLQAPALAGLRKTIITLAPEQAAFWRLGVSYVYGDLREIDFRDGWFDAITCVSTIEHIGMDNAIYAAPHLAAPSNSADFLRAVKELRRVLKPGGALCITFPFGRYERHGFLQQFDAALTDALISAFEPSNVEETIYRYDRDGWQLSDRAGAATASYFNVHATGHLEHERSEGYPADLAAAARAVACLRLTR